MSAVSRRRLIRAISTACRKVGSRLGCEAIDEMAIPSYLQGGRLSRYVFWRKLDYVVRAARLVPNSRVFDFGCGTGILLPRLSTDGRRIQATDLHLEMARDVAGALQLPRVEFVSADAWREAVPDGATETIIAANVLEHVENRREILTVFARKLTPTGRLVISGPTENRLYRLGRALVGFTGHYHVCTVREVLADVRVLGFRQVYQRRWPLPGPWCLYEITAFARPLPSAPEDQ